MGWGLTVFAYLAVVWGIARTALEVAVRLTSREPTADPATAPIGRALQHYGERAITPA